MDTSETPLVWVEGTPRSALYGDIYFSLEDGLAESRAVFLEGCGLPLAWQGRRRFIIAELGFGSGLNVCAALDLWRRAGPKDGRLHIFSVEGHPIPRQDAARALSAFPGIGDVASLLLDRWPSGRRGVHRIELPALNAVVDVAVMEAAQALDGWDGAADAWFLDGFSPALNPAMWRDEVLDLVAARSRPGARAATFTVAGEVRRGLARRGFAVEKKPGFGRKRERLEASLPGLAIEPAAGVPTLILGSGIAGASLARAFSALGCQVTVVEDPEASAASGNPAALVTPALDAGGGDRAAFYAAAFTRAVDLYEDVRGAVIDRGAYQLEAEPRDAGRFDKVALQDHFSPGTVERLSSQAVAAAFDEPSAAGGLWLHDGLVVDPQVIRNAWAPSPTPGRAVAITAEGDGWRVSFADGRSEHAPRVVIASGHLSSALRPQGPRLTPVRGQASLVEGVRSKAAAFGAYAIPTREGVLFGATHDRGDAGVDIRPADQQRNLAALAKGLPRLAADLAGRPLSARAGIRATTADRMPVAGALAPGLFVLTGLGSRGFTTAPLLAEHLAALAEGCPSLLPASLAATVSPDRFVQP